MSAGILWDRIVAIAGTDDPNELTYFTGIGYAQITRYASGKSGVVRGPSAADLAKIASTLTKRTGRYVTMGQLWGVEPLPPMDAVEVLDLPSVASLAALDAQGQDRPVTNPPDAPPPPASPEPRVARSQLPARSSDDGAGER